MTFEVEVAGRRRVVSLDRGDRPGLVRVTLDGESRVLDVARAGEFGLSLLIPVLPGGAGRPGKGTAASAVELHVTPGAAAGELLVWLGGRLAVVAVDGRRTGRTADAAVPGHGEVSIQAPMPGRIVRVLVAAGDEVAARQGIVVVEAMKMENELRTPRAGRVKAIHVTAGASVEAGRVLAVVE